MPNFVVVCVQFTLTVPSVRNRILVEYSSKYIKYRFVTETVLDPELVQPTTSAVPKTKAPLHTRRRNSTKPLQPVSPPVFDGPATSNVTARLGESTFLYCTVRNLKQRPVITHKYGTNKFIFVRF